MGDLSSSFPGTGGQFPGVPQPTGIGLSAGPGVPNSQFPSTGGVPSQTFPPGMTGLPSGQIPVSVLPAVGSTTPSLPSGIPPGLPILGASFPGAQTPGLPSASFPTRIPTSTPGITPQDLSSGIGTSQGLPELPTGSAPPGIARAGSEQPPLPGRVPVVPQLPGIPTSSPSFGGMTPPSSVLRVPGTRSLGEGGYGAMIPGTQVNPGMVPPGSSQVPGIPTDLASAGGMVPISTAQGFPGTPSLGEKGYGAMIPSSQVNSGMVPQGGLLPSSTGMPTGAEYPGDSPMPPFVNEMGAQQLQQMGLQSNIPNPDLLVREAFWNSDLKVLKSLFIYV